jgi:pyruvate/2-oxoglutarate dehydrogenase complex dihydrolipoamide acyltransferase (E2) component
MGRTERRRQRGFRALPLSVGRRWVAAVCAVNHEQNTIHLLTEADITGPRQLIASLLERSGERLSLTAYVVACLARTLTDFPRFNAFRKGRRLILLDDVTINVLFEREIDGESVPSSAGIHAANHKSYREIHDKIRAVQRQETTHVGETGGLGWLRFLPTFLFKIFVRLASRSIRMQRRYGVVAVTSIGMFGQGGLWPVPLTSATVTVAVGSIARRPVLRDGIVEEREQLCLTLSFNHDLIDGAPAARFAKEFVNELSSGRELQSIDNQRDYETD